MSEITFKVWQFGDAPKRLELHGDKTRKTESASHVIEFPGGAIELSRLDDNSYWAHIIINRDYAVQGVRGLKGSLARVVDSRIGRHDRLEIPRIEDADELQQIAVRIAPVAAS